MYRLGSYANVINPGHCYSRYDAWADKYRLAKWRRGECPQKGAHRIVKIAPHPKFGMDLYAVMDNLGRTYIVDERAFKED